MKIIVVLGAFFPVPPIMGGAVEKVWFVLAQEFVRQGHEVVQISRAHPQLPAAETISGVQHLRVRGYDQPHSIVRLKWRDLLYSLRVCRILPAADILVTNTFWLPLLVRRKDRGLLYVHVARGPKGQMRWYRRAARLQAVSSAIAKQIVRQAPELREKVRVLPNALPFRVETLPNEPRTQTLLFVGRVHPEKGIELFLRALTELPHEILIGWEIRIVGPHETELGGGGPEFLRQMQSLGEKSSARLKWLGKIFDPAALTAEYRQALLFIYPSVAETGEAQPLAPLEAMANSCAPIVSALACFRDYIEDGKTGFVFDQRPPAPEEKLAARLAQVLALGREEIMKIGRAAQEQAAQFDVTKIAPRYLEDFASLLAEQPNESKK